MATLREFVLAQSSLPVGNTIRDHIENPAVGGPGGFVLVSEVEVEFMSDCIDVERADNAVDVEVADNAVDVELDDDIKDVEIGCE